MKIDRAKITDASSIHKMVNHFAGKGEMLPRALSDIYENIRDYFVIRDDEYGVVGCAALHVNWIDLAEIRSLAVEEKSQNKGGGSSLVDACLKESEELGISRVFCLTRRPAFFQSCGFVMVDKKELPHKVWAECYRCPLFPDCDEVALMHGMEE
ncbi:MAG: N-acetyltransferase [Dehalococcoidia bacterium]|nr:N-acetyltransferase [Dehalococcoidia bacterium]